MGVGVGGQTKGMATQQLPGAKKYSACIAPDHSFSSLQETPAWPLTLVQSNHTQVGLSSRAAPGPGCVCDQGKVLHLSVPQWSNLYNWKHENGLH